VKIPPINPNMNIRPNITARIIPRRLPIANDITIAKPIAPVSIKKTENNNNLSIITPPLRE